MRSTYVRTDVEITVTNDAESWLAKSGFNPQFGARPLKRLIQNKLLDPLASLILEVRIFDFRLFVNFCLFLCLFIYLFNYLFFFIDFDFYGSFRPTLLFLSFDIIVCSSYASLSYPYFIYFNLHLLVFWIFLFYFYKFIINLFYIIM